MTDLLIAHSENITAWVSALRSPKNQFSSRRSGWYYLREGQTWAAALFYREGYEVLKKVAYDLKDFRVEGEQTKTAVFIFKRAAGAKSDSGEG
jgi:hypothetical protein